MKELFCCILWFFGGVSFGGLLSMIVANKTDGNANDSFNKVRSLTLRVSLSTLVVAVFALIRELFLQ